MRNSVSRIGTDTEAYRDRRVEIIYSGMQLDRDGNDSDLSIEERPLISKSF
jgi:hypothetical protein